MKRTSKWLIFALLAVAQFMVVLDVAIANIALPAIKESLHFSQSGLQWVVTAYALTFGGFLLLGGRAADLFGRKQVLLVGMIAFTAFSLLIGLSQSATMLVVFRALQGLAAALMSPAALSTVLTLFKEGDERNRALGMWTNVATGGAAVGLLLGGVLSQYLSWHWNFFVNVPIGAVVAYGIYKLIPAEASQTEHKDLDLPGAVLATGGLMTLVFAFTQAPVWGWASAGTLGLMALAVGLIGAFIVNESRSKHPLMPLSIFKVRNVTGANLMMAPIMAGMMGMFFLLSLYISGVLGYSLVATGLAFLPFPIILSIVSTRVSKVVSKFGYKPFLIAGATIVAIAYLFLLRLPVHGNYFTDVLPAILLMPIGMGLTFMPVMAAATSGVPAHEAGLASGLISTSQQMGGALGLAVLSGVAASVTLAASNMSPTEALVHGYRQAFLVGVVFVLFAVVLAVAVIKQPKRQKEPNERLQLAGETANMH